MNIRYFLVCNLKLYYEAISEIENIILVKYVTINYITVMK